MCISIQTLLAIKNKLQVNSKSRDHAPGSRDQFATSVCLLTYMAETTGYQVSSGRDKRNRIVCVTGKYFPDVHVALVKVAREI